MDRRGHPAADGQSAFGAVTAPTALPVLGAVACAYLASPLSGRAGADYRIAAVPW